MVGASFLMSSLKWEILYIQFQLVDLIYEVCEELLWHGWLSGEKVYTVIKSSEGCVTTIVFDTIFFSLVLSQKDNSVVNSRREEEKLLFEFSWIWGIFSRKCTYCMSGFSRRSLVVTDVVSLILLSVLVDIQSCADTILLEKGSSGSLKFSNFVPGTTVRASWEVLRGTRVFTSIGRCY